MKKIKLRAILFCIALLGITGLCRAQTFTPLTPDQVAPQGPDHATLPPLEISKVAQDNPATAPTAVTSHSLASDLKQLGGDAWAALKDANFANGIDVEPFFLLHNSDIGGGLSISTANTNGVNLGFAIAAINETSAGKKTWNFYDATLSISYGGTVTVPLLNIPAYLYLETGPAANLADPNTVLEQSIAGAKLYFFNNKFGVGAGIGHNSAWSDPFYVFHIGYIF